MRLLSSIWFCGLVIMAIPQVQGQTLKISAGTSLSQLDWRSGGRTAAIYEKTLVGYAVFIGCDYLNKDPFNLSSQVGILQKGGQSDVIVSDPRRIGSPSEDAPLKQRLDYLSFQTTADFKLPNKSNFTPFISIGPRVDYLLNADQEIMAFEDSGTLRELIFGLLAGLGLKYDFSPMEIGIRGDYYWNYDKIARAIENTPGVINSNIATVEDQTFILGLSLGYKLR